MAKLYYEATVRVVVDTGDADEDRDDIEANLSAELEDMRNMAEGDVSVTDVTIRLVDVK
jgi:hypothetical protein